MGKPKIWDTHSLEIVKKFFGTKTPDEIAKLVNDYQMEKVGGVNLVLSKKDKDFKQSVQNSHTWVYINIRRY